MSSSNPRFPVLVGAPLRRAIRGILAKIGKTASDRFDALLNRADGPQIPLSICLEVLCPGQPQSQALTNLRKLRERFNKAAAALSPSDDGHDVRFHVDTRKKSKPNERRCWFTGRDQVLAEAEELAQCSVTAPPKFLIDNFGIRFTSLADAETLAKLSTDAAATRLRASSEILAWARDPQAPPYFALLGEFGMGKTTTVRQVVLELMALREHDSSAPLPIYIDLKFAGKSKGRDHKPTLIDILEDSIRRHWNTSDAPALTATDLIRLVQEEGAVVFFDGLDEKLVHLDEAAGREFLRTLWSILPPNAWRRGKAPAEAPSTERTVRVGRMLVSCRSHFFRDVMAQNAMLTGEDREQIGREDYRAMCLVPFTNEQIKQYFVAVLGGEERADGAMKLIGSIHNLGELAKRPYLLRLISERLDELEGFRLRGEVVNGARLYELFIRRWLARDDTKHTLDPMHKRRLMEHLAAAMWADGSMEWSVDRLERWLDQFLADTPAIAGSYPREKRGILKEDLRTATFVLRPDAEEKHFRFAHTSLQEFFLASYLATALDEQMPERWTLSLPSIETLDFLGQLLALEPERQKRHLKLLGEIMGRDSLDAARAAFRYWLRAVEKRMPEPAPTHVRLPGADLERWILRGRSESQPLLLRGASLEGAKLNGARIEFVNLSGANLSACEARETLFLHVDLSDVVLEHADLGGVRCRDASLRRARLTGSSLPGQWVRADFAGVEPATARPAPTMIANESNPPPFLTANPASATGHARSVSTCAWNHDGRRFLSASGDNTLRLWDAEVGACLRTFEGHSNWVSACAWHHDGRRFLSASYDETLRLWDAETGACLRTFEGHSNGISACAWHHDGRRFLSASGDNTLRLWDAEAGACLGTFEGHGNGVSACAWHHDGRRFLSASYDKTLRLWDAETGACLRTFEGHSNGVAACAWHHDGRRFLSASGDNTLRLWDAETGVSELCFHLLPEHQTATIDPVRRRFVFASPEAWRWLGWQDRDLESGETILRPAEAYGRLPGGDRERDAVLR